MVATVIVVGVFCGAEFSFLWFGNWKLIALGAVLLVLTIPLGVFVGMLVGAAVLSPIFYVRGIANGGPFGVGDTVQIISGKYRGRISSVYGLWQGNSFRVCLEDDAAEKFEDIFSPTDVLLIARSLSEKAVA